MSKLNKIITNQPVVLTEEEVNNLSETLSAVRTAGGGEGGHLYTGDNKYIGVDNGNYKIKFLDNAAQKLESISSKLDKTEAANTYLTSADAQTLYQTKEAMSAYAKKTDLPDSITDFADTDTVIYSYINPLTADIQSQINTKQNKLQFDLNAKGEISAIGPLNSTTALAGANGITGDYYSASNPSGFINSAQAETQILEKHYLTKASGDLLYVPIPEGLSDGQYYAMTTSSWKVIQGAGDVSGISTVAHDDTLTGNGNNENLGVDTTKIQTKLTDTQIQNITDVTTLKTASSTWDNVSAKLNTTDFNTYTATTAPSIYQEKGNYLSSNALEGYATTALLDTISSKIENDIPTKVSDLTDSANYYKTTETSSKNELSTEFAKYLTTAQYNTDSATFALKTDLNDLVSSAGITTTDIDYVMTNSGWKVLTLPGGGMTQVIHDETLTGQGNASDNKLGVVWSALSGNTINSALSAGSATSALSADNAESARYTKQLKDASKIIQISDITALQNWASSNSATWNAVSAKLGTAQYSNDSATFVTSSNASISAAGEQYALTTTGWAKVQGGGGSTVTIDQTNNEIKDGTSAVSAMSYVVNPNNEYWKPQRSCVCTEAEIFTMAGYANGQGMLFFIVSGHNQ